MFYFDGDILEILKQPTELARSWVEKNVVLKINQIGHL